MAILAMLFFLSCAPLRAQQPTPAEMPSPDQSATDQQSADSNDKNSGESGEDKEESGVKPMSLDDARTNFSTVVESFIASRSPDGYWPVRQKTTGKVLKLKFRSVVPASVHELKEGRYLGRALLREVQAGSQVKADFTVDFSGPRWEVKGMRLISVKASAHKTAAKAPAQKPARPGPA